jgi:hypothetical protein
MPFDRTLLSQGCYQILDIDDFGRPDGAFDSTSAIQS